MVNKVLQKIDELYEKNQKLLDDINDIFEKFGFTTLKGAKRTGGSDTAYTTEAGIPCLDSFGVIGNKFILKTKTHSWRV